MLGNCVLKKRTYISEDTPVTLACQEGRRCSTHRRGTPVGAKGEENLCAVFIHKAKLSLACVLGTRGFLFFILRSCFFLSVLRVGFLS